MSLQFRRRPSIQKLQSSSQDGLNTLYSRGMLRESGVKLAKEICCQMQGMSKRKLLCPEMKRRTNGVYCKKNTETMQDCQCKELEAPVARVPYCDAIEHFYSKLPPKSATLKAANRYYIVFYSQVRTTMEISLET